MGAIYTDRIPFSKRIGGQLNLGFNCLVITNAQVAAQATITLLKAAILAAVPTYNQTKIASDVCDALDAGLGEGLFSETHGQTTVAALVALTDASTTLTQGLYS